MFTQTHTCPLMQNPTGEGGDFDGLFSHERLFMTTDTIAPIPLSRQYKSISILSESVQQSTDTAIFVSGGIS